jgi:inorganic pyrophosphatase
VRSGPASAGLVVLGPSFPGLTSVVAWHSGTTRRTICQSSSTFSQVSFCLTSCALFNAPRIFLGYACAVTNADFARNPAREEAPEAPEVEVVIEIPRGSFLKRGSTGHVDFISPLPCPFNYGSVPSHLGLEGDLLDAVVLGPRLRLGARRRVKAWGAVILTDRGMSDDKLICSDRPLDPSARHQVLRFFHFYATCKGLLNFWRRRPGRNACEGWCEASEALARAQPRDGTWHGPPIEF